MRRILSTALSILVLLLSTFTPAIGQEPIPTDTVGDLWLPMVSSANTSSQRADLEPVDPDEAGLHVIPGRSFSVSKNAPDVESRFQPRTPMDPSSLQPLSVIVTFDESLTAERLAAEAQGRVIHRYNKVFRGASLFLPESNLGLVADLEGVTGIYLDQLLELDTEVSPHFIGAPTAWSALGGQSSAGEGVIVGILDSGIWPEHPSVSDPDPLGNAYAPPPVVPGSNGYGGGGPRSTCDFGNTAWNASDAPFTCNNKLIGAYSFIDTYKIFSGLIPSEFDSARDDNGHGTHTLTTAAGNAGVSASLLGVPRGTVSGVAPRAHVIAYKVCGDTGCFSSDSVAAVEQAILDGVDVINFSISGGGDPYNDIVSLAFLAAYDNGVLVSPSAGNSGPGPNTVAHREPWTLTVGASTTDRHFLSTVTLTAGGDTLMLEGASVTDGVSTPTSVVLASDFGDGLCLTPFPPGTFSGEIVICERGAIARVAKSFNVAEGGAGGMLLYNPVLQGLATDNHFIPSVHLENDAGILLLDFMSTHTGVTATFTPGTATTVQGDKMAAFSSRGGASQSLGISKPDVTAPGVQILAGNTPLPATVSGGQPGELFQSIQGTSMSAPHATGSAALLAALHPDWTPGEIKSALMLTALTDGVVKEDGSTPGDPFDYGSGRIDLNVAGANTVVMDESAANYLALESELWNSNYPSLYIPVMAGLMTVERTLRNVTDKKQEFDVSVEAPADLIVQVGEINNKGDFKEKKKIKVEKSGTGSFGIHVDARDVPLNEVRHATIRFENRKSDEELIFPVTIVRRQAAVTITKDCDPATIAKKEITTCTISVENTSFDPVTVRVEDEMPKELSLDKKSIVGGDNKGNTVFFEGALFGAAPPVVNAAVTPPSAFGYFPLSTFGVTPMSASDESIVNFGVPAFEYAGELYSQIGVVSNGYAVVGGGTGADVNFINSDFPNPAAPNNVLAPFWTDLNPDAGGALRIAILSAGPDSWIVVEWEGVPNFGDGAINDFQIWIGVDGDSSPGEEIFFVYGPDVSAGDGGFLTVGAENKFGNSGQSVYFDGAGALPTPTNTTGYEVSVFSTPGTPGETHEISFEAKGKKEGSYSNYAIMTSDSLAGDSVAAFYGHVTK